MTWRVFLSARSGGRRANARDLITYSYLIIGAFIMLAPVLWGVMSSFKSPESIDRFPPESLPRAPARVEVDGFDEPLPLFNVELDDGTTAELAQVRRIGLEGTYVDPDNPTQAVTVHIANATGVREIDLAFNNYSDPLQEFDFLTFFKNSAFVTVTATLITLLFNSMAAFALSKYQFRGRGVLLGSVVSQLLLPSTVLLVPLFLVVHWLGWFDNLNALIWPVSATPTGVFLLRQYMLTIPDDMLDAARVDGATEWRVYWETVVPLSMPAISVLTIFSVMWRWNDFIWPLIIIGDPENYTLPLGLSFFSTEFDVRWGPLLAMTVLTLLPVTIVFAMLQRSITTGIASMGVKVDPRLSGAGFVQRSST